MLKKESTQKDFFDSYVYDRLLPKKHVLLDIKRAIDFSFVDNETKDLYSKTMGRPSFPPQIIFKMLFLEFFYNLSDYEIEEQVKANVLFRYFAGLSISSPTPDNTTVAIFRKRLGEERFKRLFDRVVLQAKGRGLIEGKLKVLDSTHIDAHITVKSAVNLLKHGRKVVIKKISKVNPKEADKLERKYADQEEPWNSPREGELKKEIAITREFIDKAKDRFDDEVVKEVITLLETALGQQTRKADDPKHKEPDEVVTFADKDARRGAKSITKRFVGYKAHASMDEGSNIVTSVRTIPGNRNEGAKDETRELLDDDKSKKITHEAVAADSLYDSYENRKNIHKQHMRAFITRSKKGNSKLSHFIYDDKNDTVICPQGYSAPYKYRQGTATRFYFPGKLCRKCPNEGTCPNLHRGRVLMTVSDNHRLSLIDNVPEKKEAFVKRRSIERKFGEAKVWHKLNRARYRERTRVAIQVFMTFMALNIKRMATLLVPVPEYALCKTGFG